MDLSLLPTTMQMLWISMFDLDCLTISGTILDTHRAWLLQPRHTVWRATASRVLLPFDGISHLPAVTYLFHAVK